MKCARGSDIRDFFHVAVLGYGQATGSAFTGPLAGRDLVPISDIAKSPARVEERVRKIPDGVGGLIEERFELPIWIDPINVGGTPMTQVFEKAQHILRGWLQAHSDCYPPMIINVTDGEADDPATAATAANALKSMSSLDGSVLLFNIHISSINTNAVVFPASEVGLPDDKAVALFRMSSELPPQLISFAKESGLGAGPGSRGFAFNTDMTNLISILDVGTKTALSLSAAR